MPIRLASTDDVVRMHQIRMSVLENRLSHPDRIRHEDYLARLDGAGRGWVFERDGAILGFGVADAGRRNIWALFVAPGFERLGIGRGLLTAMTTWLFEQSPEPVWLMTAPGTRAERFYRAAGWRDAGRINDEIRFELTAPPAAASG